jgi:hypothetical protein
MAALTNDRTVTTKYRNNAECLHILEYPVKTATTIYKGAMVVIDAATGYAIPAVAGTANFFIGIALEQVATGAGASGSKTVAVAVEALWEENLTGAAITDVGDPVYAADDNSLTLTAGTNTPVGWIEKLVGTNRVLVRGKPIGAPIS